MLSLSDLTHIAQARLADASALASAGRYDGSVYLCGYAVEVALKARICRSLGWPDFPATSGEFRSYRSFQTHDLDVLLHLSGVEASIKGKHLAEWSTVAQWDPEVRYRSVGGATAADASSMLTAATTLLGAL